MAAGAPFLDEPQAKGHRCTPLRLLREPFSLLGCLTCALCSLGTLALISQAGNLSGELLLSEAARVGLVLLRVHLRKGRRSCASYHDKEKSSGNGLQPG